MVDVVICIIIRCLLLDWFAFVFCIYLVWLALELEDCVGYVLL